MKALKRTAFVLGSTLAVLPFATSALVSNVSSTPERQDTVEFNEVVEEELVAEKCRKRGCGDDHRGRNGGRG